jgi:hypothetical protein
MVRWLGQNSQAFHSDLEAGRRNRIDQKNLVKMTDRELR